MDAAEARHRDEIAKKCTNLKNELLVVLLFAKLIVIETSSRQRARQLIIQQMFDHAHHLKIIGRAANKHLGGDRDRPVRAVKCSACGCFTTCPLAGSSNPDCNVDACPCLVLDTATRATIEKVLFTAVAVGVNHALDTYKELATKLDDSFTNSEQLEAKAARRAMRPRIKAMCLNGTWNTERQGTEPKVHTDNTDNTQMTHMTHSHTHTHTHTRT